MTMTSGVGTPFFMAPEMATGTKHYTGAVVVFSFCIMAAQVMVGRLVYDSSDSFDSQSNFVGFCQSTSWQRASHTVSKERGGDYRAMASCQGVLSEG